MVAQYAFDKASKAVDTRRFLAYLGAGNPLRSAMPTGQPLCPRCQDNLYVRAEQILSGRRVLQAFYCGRCNHEWTVENGQQAEERRQGERRKRKRKGAP
jgi:transposase-like protein